jgi:hypothetical protein
MLIPVQSEGEDPFALTSVRLRRSLVSGRQESQSGTAGDKATTDVLVARIAEVNAVCDWLLQPYRLWCLANGYDLMAETLLPFGGYRDVRQVLKRTAGQLRAIAEANVDLEVEPVVLRRRDGGVTARSVGADPGGAPRRGGEHQPAGGGSAGRGGHGAAALGREFVAAAGQLPADRAGDRFEQGAAALGLSPA